MSRLIESLSSSWNQISGIPQTIPKIRFRCSPKDSKNLSCNRSAKNKSDKTSHKNWGNQKTNQLSSPLLLKVSLANLRVNLTKCVTYFRVKCQKITSQTPRPRRRTQSLCRRLCASPSKPISINSYSRVSGVKSMNVSCRWSKDLLWMSSRMWWSTGREMQQLTFWMKFLKKWRSN